jgi:hypothetical protein
MAKFIAHRGNTNGPNPADENTIEYLRHAWKSGYDVECDLIGYNGKLYFGHDEPQDLADINFLKEEGVWCHAKNTEALVLLDNIGSHYFWHQEDNLTLTSKNYFWCFPGVFVDSPRAVWLDLHGKPLPNNIKNIYGVCGDIAIT